MREIDVPATTPLDPDENLTDVIVVNAHEVPDLAVLSRRGPHGWVDVTAVELLAEVRTAAKGFVAAGIGPGDRVALLSRTRYEWTVLDLAIWFAGAVTVPVYETSSPEQVRWILADSGAVGIVVESPEHKATVSGVQSETPALQHVWCIDEGAMDHLAGGGETVGVSDAQLEERRRTLRADSVATLIYTSGTTGRPKGCELTHANFLGLARGAGTVLEDLVTQGRSTLLFLPLAHVFARFVQVLALVTRAKLGHSPGVATLLDDLQEFRPTFLLAVPRVFEKIYNGAEASAQAQGRGPIFATAAQVAVDYSRAQDTGGAGLVLRLKHALLDRLVYRKLRAATGGALVGSVSGGAPLGERLGHFFRGIGMPVLEGWGLTETTAPATVNTLPANRIGTVGRPLPGVAVRVADDGELQVRGVGVLAGYHRHEQGGAEAFTPDGWFATGDLGEIDKDGFVRITGRKKEILVTAGGKNVAPAGLEDRMRANPIISQVMVVGDGRPFVAALVTLDAEMLPGWLGQQGRSELDVATAAQDEGVRAEIQKAVDGANTTVSKAESIRKFTVLDTDFTEASGHLTPKLSLKRPVVLTDFADTIDGLYR